MGNQCCLCGGEGKELTEGVCACDSCIIDAVYESYGNKKDKKPWFKTRLNWGFWILVVGFSAFLITWFIVRPMMENGG